MPASKKAKAHPSKARGASEVGALWFVLTLILTVIFFGWYLDALARLGHAKENLAQCERATEARKDRNAYKMRQLEVLTKLVGFASSPPSVSGGAEESSTRVSRVRDCKKFAEELVNLAQPLFQRDSPINKYKPDFYLKRVLDRDEMIPPLLPTKVGGYDAEAFKSAPDKVSAGLALMQKYRSLFRNPFTSGAAPADIKNTQVDGKAQIESRDIRVEWLTRFDNIDKAIATDTAEDEISAISGRNGGGAAMSPAISIVDIVQKVALGYSDLSADVRRLREALDSAKAGEDPGKGASWNDLRFLAQALANGTANDTWSGILDQVRGQTMEALKTALADLLGQASDDPIAQWNESRGEKPPDDLAKAELWHRVDLLVRRVEQIDRRKEMLAYFTASRSGQEPYTASTRGYRNYLISLATATQSAIRSALADMRKKATAYEDDYSASFAEFKKMPAALYPDPYGRVFPEVGSGGSAKDIAEAVGLPSNEGPGVEDHQKVVQIGIANLQAVKQLITFLGAELDRSVNETIAPATVKAREQVQSNGQRLGSLLVSDAIETVFADVPRGHILDAPVGSPPSIRALRAAGVHQAFIDLDSSDKISVGLPFLVYQPMRGGTRLLKALAVVDRVGKPGHASHVKLRYLPGVDPLTKPVVKGDYLANPIFNATYRRNAVVLTPEGQEYLADEIKRVLIPHNFAFQTKLDENTDMVILTGSRSSSLSALVAAAGSEDLTGSDEELKPWFQSDDNFKDAQRRGLSIFFFEDDIRQRIPGAGVGR